MRSITENAETTTSESGSLDIVVPYTTKELTRLALRRAEALSAEIRSRIRIVRLQRVPFPLELQQSPIAVDVLREQTQQVALGMPAAEILIFLTRDPADTLLKTLRPGSILVIASKKRWWRTAQERLQRFCARNGHEVAIVYA